MSIYVVISNIDRSYQMLSTIYKPYSYPYFQSVVYVVNRCLFDI